MLLEILAAAATLYIGDSHSTGCFGRKLDQTFRQNNQITRTSATCGSSTASWLKAKGHSTKCGYLTCPQNGSCSFSPQGTSPSLASLLKANTPKTTVVALGTNMLKSNWSATMNDVISVIRLIHEAQAKCVWIGPPQAGTQYISVKKYDEFVDLIKNTVINNGCKFIDSSNKTDRRKITDPTGLHYNCREGNLWADLVAREI